MAALVQSEIAQTLGAGSGVVVLGAGPTEGNLVVVIASGLIQGTTLDSVVPTASGAGLTFTEHVFKSVDAQTEIAIWSAPVGAGVGAVITLAPGGPGDNWFALTALEFSGMDITSGRVNDTGHGSPAASSDPTTDDAAVITTGGPCVMVGGWTLSPSSATGSTTIAAASGWTQAEEVESDHGRQNAIYREEAASGTFNPTWAISSGAVDSITAGVAFKTDSFVSDETFVGSVIIV